MVNDLHFLSQFQKVYTEGEATQISITLADLFTRYKLLKENKYSNDTSKFFIKAICTVAIIGMPSLSV